MLHELGEVHRSARREVADPQRQARELTVKWPVEQNRARSGRKGELNVSINGAPKGRHCRHEPNGG